MEVCRQSKAACNREKVCAGVDGIQDGIISIKRCSTALSWKNIYTNFTYVKSKNWYLRKPFIKCVRIPYTLTQYDSAAFHSRVKSFSTFTGESVLYLLSIAPCPLFLCQSICSSQPFLAYLSVLLLHHFILSVSFCLLLFPSSLNFNCRPSEFCLFYRKLIL